LRIVVAVFTVYTSRYPSSHPTNSVTAYKDIHTQCFNGHFSGKFEDPQSPVIHILSILTGQTKTLRTHTVLYCHPKVFWSTFYGLD